MANEDMVAKNAQFKMIDMPVFLYPRLKSVYYYR